MGLNLYFLVFLLCGILKTYILYKFYHLFFKETLTPKTIEIGTYILAIIINALLNLYVDLSIIILLFNIIGGYLLTYNYKARRRNRIFVTLFFFVMAMLIESFVVIASTTVPVNILEKSAFQSIQGPIFTTIFVYLFLLMLKRWKNVDKQINIPFIYWFMLVLIPLSSLAIILLLMNYGNMTENAIAVCCLLLFIINLFTFHLYDNVVGYLSNKIENQFLAQQNMYYNRLLKNIELSTEATRTLQHDLKNHVIAMEGLLEAKEYDHLSQYLKETFYDVLIEKSFIDTGNTAIDSILNFKIKEAQNKGISLLTDIAVPEKMQLSNEMLTVILGNLLDNAIEATESVTGEKKIRCKLQYDRQCLFITITNPYEGRLKKLKNTFMTTKRNEGIHGYGLNSIKEMIKRNHGNMNIDDRDQRFTVNVTLYDSKKEDMEQA